MKKTIVFVALTGLALPGLAMAKDSSGCGLGTMIFDGESGVAPQVLAVTTNGTSGNQTFGISSGTLGCDQQGTIDSLAEFTADNMDKLAADAAAGEGETLVTARDLMGIDAEHQERFNQKMQDNFDRIFSSTDTTAEDVVDSMEQVIAEDTQLAAA